MVSDETPYQDSVISDFYLQIHMNIRLRSLILYQRKSCQHCIVKMQLYISPPELPKSVFLNAQQSDSLTNMTNYVSETLLSPAEWTQSVCLNSQPSGFLTNLTNYVSEPLTLQLINDLVSLHIPPSTEFSCENAQPSNVPEWTENPLTNYPFDPLSTQLINESISFAPPDKFQPFTDMTCLNKQSSDKKP